MERPEITEKSTGKKVETVSAEAQVFNHIFICTYTKASKLDLSWKYERNEERCCANSLQSYIKVKKTIYW